MDQYEKMKSDGELWRRVQRMGLPQASGIPQAPNRHVFMREHETSEQKLQRMHSTLDDKFVSLIQMYRCIAEVTFFTPQEHSTLSNCGFVIEKHHDSPEGQTCLDFQSVGDCIICKSFRLNGGDHFKLWGENFLNKVYLLPQSNFRNTVEAEQYASGTKISWKDLRPRLPECPEGFDQNRYRVLESIVSIRWIEPFVEVFCRLLVNFFIDPSGFSYDEFYKTQFDSQGEIKSRILKHIQYHNGNPAPFKV